MKTWKQLTLNSRLQYSVDGGETWIDNPPVVKRATHYRFITIDGDWSKPYEIQSPVVPLVRQPSEKETAR